MFYNVVANHKCIVHRHSSKNNRKLNPQLLDADFMGLATMPREECRCHSCQQSKMGPKTVPTSGTGIVLPTLTSRDLFDIPQFSTDSGTTPLILSFSEMVSKRPNFPKRSRKASLGTTHSSPLFNLNVRALSTPHVSSHSLPYGSRPTSGIPTLGACLAWSPSHCNACSLSQNFAFRAKTVPCCDTDNFVRSRSPWVTGSNCKTSRHATLGGGFDNNLFCRDVFWEAGCTPKMNPSSCVGQAVVFAAQRPDVDPPQGQNLQLGNGCISDALLLELAFLKQPRNVLHNEELEKPLTGGHVNDPTDRALEYAEALVRASFAKSV